MNLSLLDLYRIGKSAVQLYPANPESPCLQPQAFRVLQKQRGIEVGTPNWGAVASDWNSPFFWSRKWHNKQYNPNNLEVEGPIVFMYDFQSEVESSLFAGNGFKRCYTIEIGVLDVYHEDCVHGTEIGCRARSVNQIFADTGEILDSVLLYFGKMVGAVTNVDPVEKMYYLPNLQYLKTSGAITAFNVMYNFGNTMNAANPNMRFQRVEFSATQKIYGTMTTFKFCTNNCPTIEYDNTLEDFGLLSFEAGCRDCG